MKLDFAAKPSFTVYLFHALVLLRFAKTKYFFLSFLVNLPLISVGLFFLFEGMADILLYRELHREIAGLSLNVFLVTLLPVSILILPLAHRSLVVACTKLLGQEKMSVPDERLSWQQKIVFMLRYYTLYSIGYLISIIAFSFTFFFSVAFIYFIIVILAIISLAAQNYAGILLAGMLYSFGSIISYALSFVFPSFMGHSISLNRPAYFTDSMSLASRYFPLLFFFHSVESMFKLYGFILVSLLVVLIFSIRIDFFSREILQSAEVFTEMSAGQQSVITGGVILLGAMLNIIWDVLKNIFLSLILCHHVYAAEGVQVQALIEKANSAN